MALNLTKNYSKIAGTDAVSTIDDTNSTQIDEIEADMTLIETDAGTKDTAIGLNTAKDTNVSTNLSEGTSTETTVDVDSSDGTNATLVAASTIRAGILTKAKFDEVVANTAKTTNATHTGDVTGATALTIGADKVNDTHIDFGVGANQVSAVDVPIADAGTKITATEVEGALQENRTAIDLNTAKTTNATHTGEVTGATALTVADNIIDEANLKLDEAPTNDFVLTADSAKSGGMKWLASASGFSDPMTTRGDIIYKNATITTRLPVGTADQVLTADGTDIAWATLPTMPTGDIVGTTDTQTLTNKTIDGNNNTITGIGEESINNLLKNGNFINASTDGYGGLADDWVDDGNANPVQGGFPSMTKQELIDLLGVTDANIEGLWNLNEASGNAIDLSSNGYDLTDTNSVLSSDDGLMGKARDFEFDNSEYFNIADASCSNLEISGSQTWICWIKPESLINGFILGKHNASAQGKDLRMNADGKIDITFQGLTTSSTVKSDVVCEVGKWYLAVAVYDSTDTKLKIWVNGIKKEVTASGSITDTNAPFQIGATNQDTGSTPGFFFDGLIQNAMVINGALSDTQVKKLWAFTSYKGTKIRRATTNGYISQDLPQDLVERLRGKDVSIVSKMYQDTASTGQVSIYDGTTDNASATSATTGSWLETGKSATMASDADQIQLRLKVSTSDSNVWFKEVAVYEGSTLVYTWHPSYDDVKRLSKILRMENADLNKGYRVEGNLAYKLGALTTSELTQDGDFGYDETNNRMYFRKGGVVKYVAMT